MWKAITLKYFKESIRDYPYATEVKKKKKKKDLLSKITKYNTNHSNLKQLNQSKLKTPSYFWLSHLKKNIRGTHVHIWIIIMMHCERPGDLTYTYIYSGWDYFFFSPHHATCEICFLTRHWTQATEVKMLNPNNQTTRELPGD